MCLSVRMCVWLCASPCVCMCVCVCPHVCACMFVTLCVPAYLFVQVGGFREHQIKFGFSPQGAVYLVADEGTHRPGLPQ